MSLRAKYNEKPTTENLETTGKYKTPISTNGHQKLHRIFQLTYQKIGTIKGFGRNDFNVQASHIRFRDGYYLDNEKYCLLHKDVWYVYR